MGFKVEGLDKLQKQLEQMQRAARALHGTHEVKLNELFPSGFMLKHSKFSSFDALLNASGFTVNTKEDFEAIPDNEFDEYIRSVTTFCNWQSMLCAGTEAYVAKKMGF